MARTYFIRTFGCQMNEHDSERIAGLLEADGLEPAASADADVVVLNTCCIRENADNKLYGNLGHLKSLKDARPGMQIVVGGCLAQKDRDLIQRGRPTSTSSSAPTTSHRAAELLPSGRPARGPRVSRDPRRVRARSRPPCRSGARSPSAWVTIQIGCDNSCAFCIVPVGAGQGDQPPVRRDRSPRSSTSRPTASSRSPCSART